MKELLEYVERQGGGNVGVVLRKGAWMVGVEFGQEAPDSPMAAGAAYCKAPTLDEAIANVKRQLGIS